MSRSRSSAIEPGGELRWNALTRRWVVIAPSRGRRPVETQPDDRMQPAPRAGVASSSDRGPRRDPACPFCPGNEAEVPAIAWELEGPEPPGWTVRAVPNRFPAFAPSPEEAPHLPARPAEGYQEVLVESPEHLDDLCDMAPTTLKRVFSAYLRRYTDLCDRSGIERVILFRNRGPRAGTSLRHPHGQLVAMAFDPPAIREQEAAFRRLREEAHDLCPICRPEAFEPGFDARLLHEDSEVRAWVPWAAESPFEVWIAPRRHLPDFRSISDEERGGLARMVGRVTRAYRDFAGDPDYNLLLHSAGPSDPSPGPLHWWIRIRPRIGTEAGLELASGVLVNPSSPDMDAEILRRGLGNTDGA